MVRVENAASKIYVGNLGDYGDKAELERAFEKYGEVISVWSRVAKWISATLIQKNFYVAFVCSFYRIFDRR